MKTLHWKSPLGTMYLAATESGLTALAFRENWAEVKARLPALEAGTNAVLEQALRELGEYFA